MQLRKFTECSCNKCKSMCRNSPCLGTPADIKKIIEAGHKEKLMFTIWFDHKQGNIPMPIIAPIKGPNGCIFQNKEGLCELHASGLKPLEGKLAIHDQADNGLRRTVGYTWISEEGISIFELFGGNAAQKVIPLVRDFIPCVKQAKISVIA